MKTKSVATTLSLLAALLFALSLAVACGDDDGGGEPTGSSDPAALSEYFTDLQRIFEDADEATAEAEATLNETSADATLDVQISARATYLAEIDAIFNEAIRQLDDLDVPPAAEEHHQDFIDGVSASVAAGEDLRNDLTDITTDEELDAHLSEYDSAIDAAVDKTAAACRGLQEVADTENVDIDLNCEA